MLLNTETAHFNIRGAKVGIIGLYQLDGSAGEVLPSAMSKIENDDLKIVQVHWGEENQIRLQTRQVSLAHRAIDMGADLVIGHHPHVLRELRNIRGKYIC